MAFPIVNGVKMSAKRNQAIDALFQLSDYSLVPPAGKEVVPTDVQLKTLGMSTGSLARMEQDGIIKRVVDSKRTRKITLTKEWAPYAQQRVLDGLAGKKRRGGRPRKTETGKRVARTTRGGGKRQATAQLTHGEVLPQIGTSLTVFLVQQDADGTYHVGLRDGEQSWLTLIEGITQRV